MKLAALKCFKDNLTTNLYAAKSVNVHQIIYVIYPICIHSKLC